MSLTAIDFEGFIAPDLEDDETVPLGETFQASAVDTEIDPVEAVRGVREQA